MERLKTPRAVAVLLTLALLAGAAISGGGSAAVASKKQTGNEGAGGKAVAHYAGGARIASGNVAQAAPISKLYRIGVDSGEPTLGVTQAGEVFTSAIQTNTRVEVVRSTDGGSSWEIVSPKLGNRNAQLLSFDPYTYIDMPPEDRDLSRVFTIDLTVACSYLSYSDDGGDSWVTNPLVCGRPVNDHQTLFGGPPTVSETIGWPTVIYYCWNDIATSSCQKSTTGGITWTATGGPAFPGANEDGELCGGLHGHGFVGPDGTVYLPRGYCGQPWLAMSKDEGATWERVQVAKNGATGHEASVAADKAGNIYYTYLGRDRRPYLVYSKNKGKKWSKPLMIGAPGLTESNLPSLAIGGKGTVAVAYMGTENGPKGPPFPNEGDGCDAINPCTTPSEYDKTTWNGYITVTKDVFAKRPVFYSATVNDKRDPLTRRTCGPGRCNTSVYDFIDVVVDRTGQVWSAWVDNCIAVCITTGPNPMGAEGIVGKLTGIRLK